MLVANSRTLEMLIQAIGRLAEIAIVQINKSLQFQLENDFFIVAKYRSRMTNSQKYDYFISPA